MDYSFKNRTPVTKQMFTEPYWKITFYSKAETKCFVLQLLRVAVVLAAAFAWTFVALRFPALLDYIISVFFWGAAAYMILHECFQAHIYARKRMKEHAAAPRSCTEVFFCEKYFSVHSALYDTETKTSYTNIQGLRQTAHYLLIFTDDNSAYALAKDGFEGATAEEAYQFLRSKMHS